MENFIIQPNEYLTKPIIGFYHSEYHGGGRWRLQGTIENMICTLKNDIIRYSNKVLQEKVNKLSNILRTDLPQIPNLTGINNLTVCIVPRAKAESKYRKDQLLFKKTVSKVVNQLEGFFDGTNFIIRCEDTQTTHLRHGISRGGNGPSPYPGITKDTCIIRKVRGKDILLIDDLYTKTINIVEDAIQALLDVGARTVIFYSVGKTVAS